MGLFGKKKDFWDEDERVSDTEAESSSSESGSDEPEYDIEDDGRWHPTKSTPLKVFARILLFISAVVLVVSGLVVYTYFGGGGTLHSEPNYYQSTFFGTEYQKSVLQLIRLIKAVETRGDIPESEREKSNKDLVDNYLTSEGNFSFVVYDENDQEVIMSNEDAVKRIESSHYFVKIDTTEGGFEVNTGVYNDELDTSEWKAELASCSGYYTIYAAVDNELTSTTDGFYTSYESFKVLGSMFGIMKIALIVAAVVFVLSFIFSIVATGNVRGYRGIRLTWFDKIFTEISLVLIVLFVGGSLYGAFYLSSMDADYGKYAVCGALVLAYIFFIRGYFSMVRRIKSGTFISNMLIYRIFEVIGTLPTVPRILLIILVLVLLNGALVLALFNLDSYAVMGIPVVYVIVPIIFVLENISFITWVIRKGNEEYDDEDDEDDEDQEENAEAPEREAGTEHAYVQTVLSGDTRQASELEEDLSKAAAIAASKISVPVSDDWENMDLGASVDQAILSSDTLAQDDAGVSDHTVVLPKDEIDHLLSQTSTVRDSATSFDFIQLNRDIRKLHRKALKESGIAVTLRAPDKPIVLEMNKEDMWKAISMIYDNLEQYTEPDSRIYAEMYTQNGKLIYIVKNAVKEEAIEAAKAVTSSGAELTGGLKVAKEIIEKNHGKFVVAMDGNIFKTGILLNKTQNN